MLALRQAAVLILTRLARATFGIKRSCSQFDYDLVRVGYVLSIVFIVFFFFISLLVFAGFDDLSCRSLTVGWLNGLKRLLLLSLGYATATTACVLCVCVCMRAP